MATTVRLSTGKRAELYVFQKLLDHDIVPYIPLVDVEGVDLLVKTAAHGYVGIQIKSRGILVTHTDFNGTQIKNLRRGAAHLSFDYLVIVLRQGTSGGYEAWVVPANGVAPELSQGGDLNMSAHLLNFKWGGFKENWGFP